MTEEKNQEKKNEFARLSLSLCRATSRETSHTKPKVDRALAMRPSLAHNNPPPAVVVTHKPPRGLACLAKPKSSLSAFYFSRTTVRLAAHALSQGRHAGTQARRGTGLKQKLGACIEIYTGPPQLPSGRRARGEDGDR